MWLHEQFLAGGDHNSTSTSLSFSYMLMLRRARGELIKTAVGGPLSKSVQSVPNLSAVDVHVLEFINT
jgi:hypothetical protein